MTAMNGSAQASMHAALDNLDRASTSDAEHVRAGAFQAAMLNIVNLAAAIDAGDQPTEAELADFKTQAVDLLNHTSNRGNLAGYISDAETAASRALQPGAYHQAALARTAVQLLLDRYPTPPDLLDEHDHDDLDHIDEALREAAEEHPPLPAEDIPAGLSDTHWWWTAPHGDPDTYELLHGHTEDDSFP